MTLPTLPMSLENIQELIYKELKVKRSKARLREWMKEAGVQPVRTRPSFYHPQDVSRVLWGNTKPQKVETVTKRRKPVKDQKPDGIYVV